MLEGILSALGFAVEFHEDLVAGRLSRVISEVLVQRLRKAGRLVGFSRQREVKNDEIAEVYAPACLEGNSFAEVVAGAGGRSAREDMMGGSGRVLVLDDEPTVCERLEENLKEGGYDVETFTDSATALRRLEEKTFDVVVTDLRMKGPTGMEVLQAVRAGNLPTQVIIITGYGSFEESREAEFRGVFEFVTKPFKAADLERLVERAAREARRRARRE